MKGILVFLSDELVSQKAIQLGFFSERKWCWLKLAFCKLTYTKSMQSPAIYKPAWKRAKRRAKKMKSELEKSQGAVYT